MLPKSETQTHVPSASPNLPCLPFTWWQRSPESETHKGLKAPQCISSPAEIFSQQYNTPMTHLNNEKQKAMFPGAKDGMQESEFQGLESSPAMTDSQAVISVFWVHGPFPTTIPKCPGLPQTQFPVHHTPEQTCPTKTANQNIVEVFRRKNKRKRRGKKACTDNQT